MPPTFPISILSDHFSSAPDATPRPFQPDAYATELKDLVGQARLHGCDGESSFQCDQLSAEIIRLIPTVARQLDPRQKMAYQKTLRHLGLADTARAVQPFSKPPIVRDGGVVTGLLFLLLLSGCDSIIEEPRPRLRQVPEDTSDGHFWDVLEGMDASKSDEAGGAPDASGTGTDAVPPEIQTDGDDPDAPLPAEVACDGLDEDENGVTDDLPDIGKACQIFINNCLHIGINKCLVENGPELTCEVPPKDESLCNGQDDDCDGLTDEGFALNTACSAGEGVCENDGLKACSEDAASTVCTASPLDPAEEIESTCNHLDDDCDGSTDEGADGFPLMQFFGEFTSGECHPGVQVCEEGTWKTVSDKQDPIPEECDGLDNDCDLETDEGDAGSDLTRPYGQFGLGECEIGIESCQDSKWVILKDKVDPQPEACDGLDNDCDGDTDESFNLGAVCTTGQGVCENSGEIICSSDTLSSQCNAQESVPDEMQETQCNSLDDDCDGKTDLNPDGSLLTQLFGDFTDGECSQGTQECIDGNWAVVVDKSDPQPEVCDGLDNDCNGLTDEGQSDADSDGLCDGLDSDHSPVITSVSFPSLKTYLTGPVSFGVTASDFDGDALDCAFHVFSKQSGETLVKTASGMGPEYGVDYSPEELDFSSDYRVKAVCEDPQGNQAETPPVDFTVLHPNLVGWWRFDNTSKPGADSSGSADLGSKDGQLQGDLSIGNDNGISGDYLSYSKVGQWLLVPDHDDFDFGLKDFSLSAWVYAATTGNDQYIVQKLDANNGIVLYRYKNGFLNFYTKECSTVATASMPTGQWTHIAAIRQGSDFSLYLNGQFASMGQCANVNVDNTAPLALGCSHENGCSGLENQFLGNIDEFSVFNKALTSGEVLQDCRRVDVNAAVCP